MKKILLGMESIQLDLKQEKKNVEKVVVLIVPEENLRVAMGDQSFILINH